MALDRVTPRSMMFLPADRAEMAAKVPDIAPDMAVLDLEDAIRPEAKDSTREQLAVTLNDAHLADGPVQVMVRVNAVNTPWFIDDLAALTLLPGVGAVVPKVETPAVLEHVRATLPGRTVVAGLESVRGIAAAMRLLEASPDGVYFGAEDFVSDLGGRRTRAGIEVLHARSAVLLAATLHGCFAIDQAVVDVHDDQAFVDDANTGRDLGYSGKLCLHPRQVELCHAVFSPSADELDHAHRVIEAAAAGVGVVDGAMVDRAHVRRAEGVLARARGRGHGSADVSR